MPDADPEIPPRVHDIPNPAHVIPNAAHGISNPAQEILDQACELSNPAHEILNQVAAHGWREGLSLGLAGTLWYSIERSWRQTAIQVTDKGHVFLVWMDNWLAPCSNT